MAVILSAHATSFVWLHARMTYLEERITETSNVPVHRLSASSGINDRVVLILHPSITAIGTVHHALRLGVGGVRDLPVRRQLLHGSVEDEQSAVLFALQVHRLSSATEDSKAIVGTIASWSESYGLVVTPAVLVLPGDHVFACGVAP
jgi:hypothetical protein